MQDKKSETKLLPFGSQIAEALTEMIISHQFEENERLIETKLQQIFSVSRSPVREAFRDLEKRGLVEIIPHKGVYVKSITPEEIKENFIIRSVLEALAAKLSWENATSDDLNEMQNAIDGMKANCSSKSMREYYTFHLKFHQKFIKASGNKQLILILEKLRLHLSWITYSFRYYHEDLKGHYRIHEKINEILQNRKKYDPKVEDLVKDHIIDSLSKFTGYIRENQSQR